MKTRSHPDRMVHAKRRFMQILLSIGLRLLARIEIRGREKLEGIEGMAIVASNHLGRLDAFMALALVKRTDLIIVVAEKYRKNPVSRWLVEQLDLLWLERFEADLGTLKEVLRRLQAGGILLIAPEGTRSQSEQLIEGRPGAAYLAAKSGAPVIPAAITGTEDRLVKEAFLRFRRPRVRLVVGEVMRVPALPREGRDEFLRQQTDEIMAHIAALLPSSHRGVYRDHPRVARLGSLG